MRRLGGGARDRTLLRTLCGGIALLACVACLVPRSEAADSWGASLALTSDYLVRGISRTNDHGALQLDVHYLNHTGFLAGVFASNTQFESGYPADVEFDAFVGFAWAAGGDWRSKLVANFYTYPWNPEGSKYNYVEADLDLIYRDWLDFTLVYSPDAPRYLAYEGLFGAATESAEVNLQRPVWGRLSGAAGIGYSHVNGPDASGYTYWSVGAAYDLGPVSLAASYVDTTAAAKALYYNNAGGRHWVATLIWRF
ncbi:MAG: hypothetical protein QOD56_2567 [Gammaproteobacteria bacterium]|nr:hypothetical protein [Gammaproteobacteria bacterium]